MAQRLSARGPSSPVVCLTIRDLKPIGFLESKWLARNQLYASQSETNWSCKDGAYDNVLSFVVLPHAVMAFVIVLLEGLAVVSANVAANGTAGSRCRSKTRDLLPRLSLT